MSSFKQLLLFIIVLNVPVLIVVILFIVCFFILYIFSVSLDKNNVLNSEMFQVYFMLGLTSLGLTYPHGGPDSSCQTMQPTGHGVPPQSSPVPYKLIIRKSSFNPGETIPGKHYCR